MRHIPYNTVISRPIVMSFLHSMSFHSGRQTGAKQKGAREKEHAQVPRLKLRPQVPRLKLPLCHEARADFHPDADMLQNVLPCPQTQAGSLEPHCPSLRMTKILFQSRAHKLALHSPLEAATGTSSCFNSRTPHVTCAASLAPLLDESLSGPGEFPSPAVTCWLAQALPAAMR